MITLGAVKQDGKTALMWATHYGNIKMVETLLHRKCLIDYENQVYKMIKIIKIKLFYIYYIYQLLSSYLIQDGETALNLACIKNHEDIVKLLLKGGAMIDYEDKVNNEMMSQSYLSYYRGKLFDC